VRTAPYDENQVYRLHGTMGFAIDLIVSSEEEFAGISGGDLESVVVAANKQRLTIKPTIAPLSTNFTVLTNLRVYHIEYHVGARQEKEEPELFSVQFIYAPKPAAGPSPTQKIEQVLRSPVIVNTDYWYCGDLALEPVSASDDGMHTRLTFSANTEWPAIYVLHSDGVESLVNFSVQGDTAVIHRLFERLILRRGNLVGCVFNRALIREQHSPHSGTISPEVARTLKGSSR
jgi:type IV secretion system protein VirB9